MPASQTDSPNGSTGIFYKKVFTLFLVSSSRVFCTWVYNGVCNIWWWLDNISFESTLARISYKKVIKKLNKKHIYQSNENRYFLQTIRFQKRPIMSGYGIYDPTFVMNGDVLNGEMKEGWIKLGFYMISFFYYLYW